MIRETLQKQIEEYKAEITKTTTNRDQMIGMVNQQEVRIQQLLGAVVALERILKMEETPNVTERPITDRTQAEN